MERRSWRAVGFEQRGRWNRRGLFAGVGLLAVGCAERIPGPGLMENQRLGPMTLAVAPVVEQGGIGDEVGEHLVTELANELSYVKGIRVIPPARTLAVLHDHGLSRVETAAQAMELLDVVGADAILLAVVTEFDPYDPPKLGLILELVGSRPGEKQRWVDPVALSRSGTEWTDVPEPEGRRVLAQVQRVIDASHEDVAEDIKRFAKTRNAEESPFGHRLYMVSQRKYLQYCSHAAIRMLLDEVKAPEQWAAARN